MLAIKAGMVVFATGKGRVFGNELVEVFLY